MTVATTGSDIGNCQSSPCKTLGYALSQARRNDNIVIHRRTYPESDNANVVGPGLTGLRIRSTGSATRTVIDATGNANGIRIGASGVSVTGLTVKNANLGGHFGRASAELLAYGTNLSSGQYLACEDRRQRRRAQRPGLQHEPPARFGLPQFAHRR